MRAFAAAREVMFTLKARRELANIGMGLDEEDACVVLAELEARDFSERLASEATGEWLYVFKPVFAGTRVYVKVALRTSCILVSFHEDEGDDGE